MNEEARFKEQTRYLFTGTIIASFLSLQDNITSDRYLYMLLIVSTALSAIYLVMSAASLRYFDDEGEHFLFLGEKLRMVTYDSAINIYGTGLIHGSSFVITKKIVNIYGIDSSRFWIIYCITILALVLLGVIFRELNIFIDKRDREALFWKSKK